MRWLAALLLTSGCIAMDPLGCRAACDPWGVAEMNVQECKCARPMRSDAGVCFEKREVQAVMR